MSTLNHLIGSRLKRDIEISSGSLLLSANTILREEHIEEIMKHNAILTENDVVKKTSTEMILEATEQVKDIFLFTRQSNKIPINEIRNKIIPAIKQVCENPNLYNIFTALRAQEDYTYRHNIGVAVIATLIGKWLKLSSSELSVLTTAATLHDIGKMRIPNEILNKPGKLTAEEFEVVKRHTIYGYELIKNTVGISHRVALVALQHHEREDGGGYPFGIKGDKIYMLSKIVAVSDVFHAMTSKRVYHDAVPFYQVINQMNNDVFGKLDPQIIAVFLQRIMNTLVGNDVILTDGRQGTIVMIHPDDTSNPLVKVGQEFIDLSKEPTVHLEHLVSPTQMQNI